MNMPDDADPATFGLLKRRSTLQRHGPSAAPSGGRGVLDSVANIANLTGAGNRGLQVGQNMGFINYHVSHVVERGVAPLTVYDAPDRMSSQFVGRLNELDEIRSALNQSDAESPTRSIIFGMPGLGKSVLALKYADEEFKAKTYSHVFWMSAASPDKLASGMSKLLDLVAFPGRETLDHAARRTAAKTWLEDRSNDRRWLLLLDNANQDTMKDIQDTLPRSNGRGRILMTCRTKSTAESLAMAYGESFPIISLKVLGLSESIELLLRSRYAEVTGQDQEQAESLVKSIGYLPLAIDQAASLLTATGSNIAELAETYRSDEIETVRYSPSLFVAYEIQALGWENELSRYEEKSIIAVYSLAIAELQKSPRGCMGLLKILAFLDPEDIPVHILRDGTSELDISTELEETRVLLNNPIELAGALQHLEKLSLIIKTGNATVKVHDLVQRILRLQLMKDKDIREAWFDHTSSILCSAFEGIENPFTPQAWERSEPFVAQFQALINYGGKGQKERLWDVCNSVALYLNQSGQYEEAEHMVKKVIAAISEVRGNECEAVLENMSLLIHIHSNQGSYNRAETVGIRANDLAQKNCVEIHLRLAIMLNLAAVFLCQGRVSEAESMEIDAVELATQDLEEDDPICLAAMENLAMTYLSQNRFEEAEKLQIEILEKRKHLIDGDLQLLWRSMFDLAMVYFAQGNLGEAEKLFQEIDVESRGLLADDHPFKLGNTIYLAATYWRQGRITEAEKLEKDTLRLLKRTLGEGHPVTISCTTFMVALYLEQDRLAKARKLGEKALEDSRKTLGSEHSATLTIMNLLVNIYFNQGRLEKADQLLREATEIGQRALEEESIVRLMTIDLMARSSVARNRLWEAENIILPALDVRIRIFGMKHDGTQKTMAFLASIYRGLGQESRAVEVERQAREAMAPPVEAQSPDPPFTELGTELYDDPAMQSLVNCLTSGLFSPDATVTGFLGFINSPPSPEDF